MKPSSLRQQTGVSLVDQMLTLGIVSLALGLALPNFNSLSERRSLEGAAGQLESELQFARGLAVEENQAVRFTFESTPSDMCYIIHTGGPKDCHCATTAEASCKPGTKVFRHARSDDKGLVSVQSNSRSFAFDPVGGTVTPTATMELRNRRGEALRLIVNIMGRIRSCSVNGEITGLPRC